MQVEGPDLVTRARASSGPRQCVFERLMGGAAPAAARGQTSQGNSQELCVQQSGMRRTPEQQQQQQQQ